MCCLLTSEANRTVTPFRSCLWFFLFFLLCCHSVFSLSAALPVLLWCGHFWRGGPGGRVGAVIEYWSFFFFWGAMLLYSQQVTFLVTDIIKHYKWIVNSRWKFVQLKLTKVTHPPSPSPLSRETACVLCVSVYLCKCGIIGSPIRAENPLIFLYSSDGETPKKRRA